MKILIKSLLLFSFATSVVAESVYNPGEFYFSPGVAYYNFSDKRALQNSAMADISAGFIVSNQFSLEAFYGQASTEELPSNSDQHARFYMYSTNGVYHFNQDAQAIIHPYALAGLSITNQADNNTVSGNTTLLGINAGIGVEYFVNPSISLVADARDVYTLSGGQNDWMISGGIKFLFGGNTISETSVEPATTDGPTGFYQLQEPIASNQ